MVGLLIDKVVFATASSVSVSIFFAYNSVYASKIELYACALICIVLDNCATRSIIPVFSWNVFRANSAFSRSCLF